MKKKFTKEELHAHVLKERAMVAEYLEKKLTPEEFKTKFFKLHENLTNFVVNSMGLRVLLGNNPHIYDDLAQNGSIGMIIAFNKMKWESGNLFANYATMWIKKYIYEELARLSVVKAPKGEITTFAITDETDFEYEENKTIELDLSNFALNEYFRNNEIKINVFSDFQFKGESMRSIGGKYGLTHQEVSEIVRGRRKNGILFKKPFIEVAKQEIGEIIGEDITDFRTFLSKYG